MEVLIRPDPAAASLLAAKIVAQKIREKPGCVLGLATGRTPLLMYQELIRMHREEGLDLRSVTTFNLDEYVGLGARHAQSYRWFMDHEFFQHVNIDPKRTFLPNGVATDIRQECRDYEQRIRDAGGIDLQVLGLGSNGHIGFNEPTGSLNSRTWVKILSERTLRDNAALFDRPEEMPRHCITMGIGTILDTRRCLLIAFGHGKAKAVAQMIEGPVTAMCPASALQMHRQVTIVVDEDAAARLDYADHYRWTDQHKLDWQRYETPPDRSA